MIPRRKKTPEEIAALREQLGIPALSPGSDLSSAPPPPVHEEEKPEQAPPTPSLEPPYHQEFADPEVAEEVSEPEPAASIPEQTVEPPASPEPISIPPVKSLRKRDLPLAPARGEFRKTAIPTRRKDPRSLEQVRKREALAKLNQPTIDPVTHLRKQTAGPFLLSFAYLLAAAAGVTAYLSFFFVTPLTLIGLCALLTITIFVWKVRSRHHAAILTIIIILLATFGALHYLPNLQYGS